MLTTTETALPADDPWLGCNPFDPAFRDDPYPSLARLRALDPVNEMPVVPVADRDRFTVWTSKATLGLASQFLPPETLAEVQAAGMSLATYFDELITARRGHLSDDLLSALIRAEEAGDRLAPPELL